MPKEKSSKKLKQSKKILNSLKQLEDEIREEEGEESQQETDDVQEDNLPNYEEEEQEIQEINNIKLDPEEESKIEQFMFGNIGDLIVNKFKQIEPKREVSSISPNIRIAYKKLGVLLQDYTGGKLPKAFNIIPSIAYWKDILAIMNPAKWSDASFGAAVKIFSNSPHALPFYNLVLLPKLRNQIFEEKKLNFHVYLALKKSLWKPDAFYKGIIFPLCESGTCTSREAIIIASVISKCRIPILHSAAALMKLCTLNFCGTNSYFIKTLIEKRYALPTKVVEALVQHFMNFLNEEKEMPVIWHQTLLSFVAIYKNTLDKVTQGKILSLCKRHQHHTITNEIKREMASKNTVDLRMEII